STSCVLLPLSASGRGLGGGVFSHALSALGRRLEQEADLGRQPPALTEPTSAHGLTTPRRDNPMDALAAARVQMGLSLGFHMILAASGIGMPLLMLMAEGLWLRTGRPHYRDLAREWARASLGGLNRGTSCGSWCRCCGGWWPQE